MEANEVRHEQEDVLHQNGIESPQRSIESSCYRNGQVDVPVVPRFNDVDLLLENLKDMLDYLKFAFTGNKIFEEKRRVIPFFQGDSGCRRSKVKRTTAHKSKREPW